jgi:hypothetical protein
MKNDNRISPFTFRVQRRTDVFINLPVDRPNLFDRSLLVWLILITIPDNRFSRGRTVGRCWHIH